ncbi:MAG: poly-beta-1,6 N-acetyl-D-glucosamine synthase [Pseudomonadota bacterium]|nr:MAG: poly-beta-1,6 N-acetyl-D-glucosamine synthase [Pseudomonadota bacterium]
MNALFWFVFLYPLFMAILWMMGALVFFVRRERGPRRPPTLGVHPRVAILVPCHNEEIVIRDTISQLMQNHYPNLEIIAIDDGSSDRTAEVLQELTKEFDRLRVVTLTRNYGKAMALRAGAVAASAEFLMCIDADALLDKDALFWMMWHFLHGPRVGAVTGNPRVINRTSLLARIQIGEFSAIVGMVKRTQRDFGRVFTVSGVNACYRRAALHEVGYWSPETVTEDIDVSWKLQLAYWDVRYEPMALTWILVPESVRALWRQRLRWAQGGLEAALKFGKAMRIWTKRRMWTVYVEYWVGVAWCYAFAFTVLCWAATNFLPRGVWPAALAVPTLVPGWTGVVLGVTCLAQFSVGLLIDGHYERRGLLRYLYWAIWYPAVYWLINAATTVVAVPKGLLQRGKTRFATWKSPGRRLRDLLLARRVRRGEEHRHTFGENVLVAGSRRALEVLLTTLFWGLWAYLVAPMLSLFLWFGGVYLFVDRMIVLGGYEAFARELATYSAVVIAMWVALTGWVIWNQLRYGRRNRRTVIPRHVSEAEMARSMGLATACVGALRRSQTIALHFSQEKRVIVDRASERTARTPCAIRKRLRAG